MEDYIFISLCESIGFLYLWPRAVGKTTDWSSKFMQRDNPHLRICYFARKWVTPLLFVALTVMVIVTVLDHAKEFIEIVILNLLVVISSLLIGSLASQYIVERYRVGRKHFFN
ncbi:hypothetical protein F9K33_05200 [bacterium]|nr:MAG: hypothetical protein F9K33_05200 [bacterium]